MQQLERPGTRDLDQVYQIVQNSPQTMGYLSLLGDKYLFFNPDQSAFIMYAIQGQSWIALGDPIGQKEQIGELIQSFSNLAQRQGAKPVFCAISHHYLQHYQQNNFKYFPIGQEARVPLTSFSIQGPERRHIRYIYHKLPKRGWEFQVLPQEETRKHIFQLREISDDWLKFKHSKEKSFSMGYFKESYIKQFHTAIIKNSEQIVAFVNFWINTQTKEVIVDLMRYSQNAPRSCIEYLLIELILWAQKENYLNLNLGIVPLSGLQAEQKESNRLAILWNRVGHLMYKHSHQIYNFAGLYNHKQKFHPLWEQKYIAIVNPLFLPFALLDTSSLISGGFKNIFWRSK